MPIAGYRFLVRGSTGKSTLDTHGFYTNLTSGGTVNTFGSWTQIDSDTGDRPLVITEVLINSISSAADEGLIQLGVGALSSEVEIASFAFKPLSQFSTVGTDVFTFSGLSIYVPASSRVSARFKADAASHNARIVYNAYLI